MRSSTDWSSASSLKRWVLAWPGAAVLGVANGAIREESYGKRLSEGAAQQISVATLIGGLAAYFWVLEERWPIQDNRVAFRIGGAWLVMTVTFEFGFGRLVEGQSWRDLLAAYNIAKGGTWPLVLAWIAVGPAAVRQLHDGGRRSHGLLT